MDFDYIDDDKIEKKCISFFEEEQELMPLLFDFLKNKFNEYKVNILYRISYYGYFHKSNYNSALINIRNKELRIFITINHIFLHCAKSTPKNEIRYISFSCDYLKDLDENGANKNEINFKYYLPYDFKYLDINKLFNGFYNKIKESLKINKGYKQINIFDF